MNSKPLTPTTQVEDSVTVLTCAPGKRAHKIFKADGTIDDYDAGGLFKFTTVPIGSLLELAAVIENARTRTDAFLIYGEPVQTWRDPVPRKWTGDKPTLRAAAARFWLCLDFDSHPAATLQELRESLPEGMRRAGCIWAPSARYVPGVMRGKLYILFNRPITLAEAERIVKTCGADPSVTRAGQPQYLADPHFEAPLVDPCPDRNLVIEEGPLATVPEAVPYLDNPKLLQTQTPNRATADTKRECAIDWCKRAPAAVEGQGGHNALFDLLATLIMGYGLDVDTASEIALEHYNPRCDPPWDQDNPTHAQQWQHKLDDASAAQRDPEYLIDEAISEELSEVFTPEGIRDRSGPGRGQAWFHEVNVQALAQLKVIDPARYERTMIELKDWKVERMRELEKLVAREVKKLERTKSLARLPGAKLILNDKGKPVACEANVVACLQTLPNLQFDEFSCKVTFDNQEFSDGHAVDLACELQKCGLIVPARLVSTAIASPSIPHVHAVRGYLESITWDRVERLKELPAIFGIESTDLARAYWRCWMISAVRRVLTPGCKADCMPILVGAEGMLKSTGLKVLGGTWFSDTGIDIRSKDSFQNLAGVWIYELPELTSVRRSDNEATKAFLSSATDRYRPSYGRHVVNVPRQTVFAGTTNEPEFLTALSGDRRLWVMAVRSKVDIPALVANRDQLWAEAYAAALTNEEHWLSDDLAKMAAEDREQYREGDSWQELIEPWLAKQSEGAQVTTTGVLRDALSICNESHGKANQMRVARVLRACGWERGRDWRGTKNTRVWTRGPKALPPVEAAPRGTPEVWTLPNLDDPALLGPVPTSLN